MYWSLTHSYGTQLVLPLKKYYGTQLLVRESTGSQTYFESKSISIDLKSYFVCFFFQIFDRNYRWECTNVLERSYGPSDDKFLFDSRSSWCSRIPWSLPYRDWLFRAVKASSRSGSVVSLSLSFLRKHWARAYRSDRLFGMAGVTTRSVVYRSLFVSFCFFFFFLLS